MHDFKTLLSTVFKLVSCFTLLLIFVSADAQIDSLEAAFKKASGPDRINLQLKLSDAYAANDWGKSLDYAKQAVALSKEYHNDSLLFESNFLLSKGYIGLGD